MRQTNVYLRSMNCPPEIITKTSLKKYKPIMLQFKLRCVEEVCEISIVHVTDASADRNVDTDY